MLKTLMQFGIIGITATALAHMGFDEDTIVHSAILTAIFFILYELNRKE